jgi:hypothetical protein
LALVSQKSNLLPSVRTKEFKESHDRALEPMFLKQQKISKKQSPKNINCWILAIFVQD